MKKIIISAIILIFCFLLISDIKKVRELSKSPIIESNTYTAMPAENYIPKVSENPEKEIICQYVQVLNPQANEMNKDGKVQNNKVGLYIYAEVKEFVELASEMANSNGGDWGYVLIPYNVKDYDEARWNDLFDRLANEHLIPIVQLWDLDLNSEKTDKQIIKSAQFLNSLKWPIKQRYISAYNETNDAKFWSGKVDPEGYAEVLEKTIKEFKKHNEDFFIMNGAFNASARTGKGVLDEEAYLIRMNKKVPSIFKMLDGWASHPYPQPNFSGDKNGRGRDSVRAYEWELSLLEAHFGVKDLPIFITETGWAHKESEDENNKTKYTFNQYQVADNIKYAFENVWLPDDRIIAVTPFTIKYNPPFDNFSWVTKNNSPYPQFTAIKSIEKVKGKPQIVSYYKSKEFKCE